MNKNKQSNLILRTAAKITSWFIFLFGLYIAANSSSTTAGGSAGGVLIALSAILILAAFGKSVVTVIVTRGLSGILLYTTTIFIGSALAFSALAVKGKTVFFGFDLSTITEIALKMGVALGLFAILLAMILTNTFSEKDK